MALTRKFASNRSKQVRRNKAGSKQGCGDDVHMLAGSTGSGTAEYLYRALTRYAVNWAGMKRIVKIEAVFKTETSSTHFAVGSKPRIRIQRLTQDFTDGVNHENVWTAGDYQWPGSTGGVEADCPINPATGKPTDEAWMFVDITALMKPVVDKKVLMPDGTAGGGGGFYGLLVRCPGDETSNTQRMIFHAYDVAGSANDPYILVTYDPANQAPIAPVLTGPGVTNVTTADSFEGDHSDPDGDPMAARQIVVYPAGGSTATWTLPDSLLSAGSDETQTGHFSVPVSLAVGPGALKLQTAYEWVARTKDPGGLWGPYSGRRALRITSSAPSVVATNVGNVDALANTMFGGRYSDPESNPLAGLHLQMRAATTHDDAGFADPSSFVWNTGETIPSVDEITSGLIARAYGGQALLPGTYTYRIRAQDSTGVWSAWSYDDWTLTTAFDLDVGNTTLTTQIDRNAPVRVALYRMGPDRCPGALIGYVDDPTDLGASGYHNGPGELYFTLPALHPYCPSIEPHQTHYAVQQYFGDRYRVLPEFSGIITDFDADSDTAVFYGTNYVGLLQTAIDERYDPTNDRKPAPLGSYYSNLTVDAVIRDQLTYHKGLTDSPVGFIKIGALSTLAERVTIYSTYAEALPFITGLIDSHKQGTGREARFYARPVSAHGQTTLASAAAAGATNIKVAAVTNFAVGDVLSLGDSTDVHKITAVGTAGSGGTGITFTTGLKWAYPVGEPVAEIAWEWALVDNWGKDRPNIQLEYGGLVNDFRVVALGDFATRVLGVGQKRGEVKVYRAVGTGGLPESSWGRTAKTAFFPDIIDQNDLQRRVNENAAQLAKVGKRIALALKVDALAPFDGWDLGDNIVIIIERGVVDTSGYGSSSGLPIGGYWTIYGVEFRYSPDGHTDLTLTIMPKKTATPPDPDLIPSVNPGLPVDWQVGHGVPVSYGLPPAPTP